MGVGTYHGVLVAFLGLGEEGEEEEEEEEEAGLEEGLLGAGALRRHGCCCWSRAHCAWVG